MLEPIGNARKLNAAPDPSWGLHLADGNIALGELVQNVARQIETYAAATKPRTAEPRTFLRVVCARGRAGSACSSPAPIGAQVRRLDSAAAGASLARDRRAPLSVRTAGRGRVRAVMVLRDGRRLGFTLRLPRCARR